MDSDSAIDRHPKAQEKIDRAIEFIMPEAQEDTELYERVVKILQNLKLSRSLTWSECELYKGFRAWSKVTSGNDRMNLDAFIACDAAHTSLSMNKTTDYFSQVVAERKLRQWAVSQIRGATSKADKKPNAKKARIKQEKAGQGQETSKATSEKPAPDQAERIMPSVEHSVSSSRQPSAPQRTTPDSQGASPFPSARSAKRVLDATSETHAGGPVPKTPKVSRGASRPAAPTQDATTQTEMEDVSRWVRELAGNFVEPFKQAFAKVVAAQSRTLAETLPAAVKVAVQQVLASEAAHSQSHSVFARPQVPRPAAPEAALTRQTYATYTDPVSGNSQIVGLLNYPYDDARHVGRSDVRGLAGERLVNMSPYLFHRGGEQRRH